MKNSKLFLLMCALWLMGGSFVLANGYEFSINLNDVQEDRLKVELIVPKVSSATIEYQLPKVVPGTYSISNFGRFISELKAFDAQGNVLNVEHPDDNRWIISEATRLHRISYWVEDTWDTKLEGHIFEPGGTNIEAGKNFMINNFGFFGYLEGKKELPIKLKVTKPEGFYGSTALIATQSTATEDVFEVQGYNDLADSPLMYCRPDTSIRMVGGAQILVSIYSPNNMVRASAVMDNLEEILTAQKEYLGGKLPVEKYAFLIYLTPGFGGAMGALEHSYSSMYFMPESEESATADMLRDVAAHEFFHIVTPLSIHSEEIHYFDYLNPKMSRHLWLYEGMTEYSAGLVQVKYDLISKGDYLRTLQQKITMSSFFIDSVPFTDISAGCLDIYRDQYINVYQKGALIGMALDIRLRDLSQGKMGIQELLMALSKTYGKDNPFKDDELFAKIVELTFPEIGDFFNRYVDGTERLPFADIFASVGIVYELIGNRKVLSTGRIGLRWDKEMGKYEVVDVSKANKFGKRLSYKKGDYIETFDGEALTISDFDEAIARYRGRHKAGDKIFVEVLRKQSDGSRKKIKLKGKSITASLRGMNLLMFDPNATAEQVALRNAWLEPGK